MAIKILEVIGHKPLFGNRRSKTHWLVFFFEEIKELENERV